jgi:hypothetical protein
MTNALPHANINLQEVSERNDNARHIVAGCASAMPTLTAMWRYLQDALNDALALSAEITRLSAELEHTRLDRANLLAAMRAALAAQADGEPDPMWYLRDALGARPRRPPTPGGGDGDHLPQDAPARPSGAT